MNAAYVKIWDQVVGAVAWDEAAGIASFEYEPAFAARGIELAPFSMPIAQSPRVFSFRELRKKPSGELDTFKGLPGLLADSLPDRYGTSVIDAWLAQQGRLPHSMNPVELLCFIGTRGMGALEFEPTIVGEYKRSVAIELDSLVDVARSMLRSKQDFVRNLQSEEEKTMRELVRIGTSAGGARPKAVIAFNERTGEVRSGQTKVPQGFAHWLIKLDGVSDAQFGRTRDYGRVEMAYYHMACDCGIHMMPSRLLEENGRAHFMTKRFDREGASTKHHVQTFCALKHFDFNLVNSFSYEQLFQTMRELMLPYPEAEQLYRRMVFNVLARNCDDHTKNFAFRLKQRSRWELAPAYDLCHAYQPNHRWVSRHALSINGKRDQITKEDLLATAKSVGIKKAAELIDEVNSVVARWKDFADAVNVAPSLRDEIEATLVCM